MARGFETNIWGFVLDGASLAEMFESFAELTRTTGRCDWLLVVLPGVSVSTLKVPPGYRMVSQ